MAQLEPVYQDLCRDEAGVLWSAVDEAGVIWYASEVTDDLVYVMTSVRNPDNIQHAIDSEYTNTATAETTAGGYPGKHPNYGCWLKEDWAALPAVSR